MRAALFAAALLFASPVVAAEPPAPSAATATAQGTGQVKSVDAKGGSITLHHGPIAQLGWPAMTMTFKASPDVLKSVKAGQTVSFSLDPSSNTITAISPK